MNLYMIKYSYVNGKTLKETVETFFLAWATEMGIDYIEKLLTCKQGIAGSLWYQFIDLLMPG